MLLVFFSQNTVRGNIARVVVCLAKTDKAHTVRAGAVRVMVGEVDVYARLSKR